MLSFIISWWQIDKETLSKIVSDLQEIKTQLRDLENIKNRLTTLEQIQIPVCFSLE